MRRTGLWHAELVELIVSLRHQETLVVADAGLPIGAGVPVIDLGWTRGEPPFLPVLRAILAELVVERATIARELGDGELLRALRAELKGIPVDAVPHDALRDACAAARGVVRTGEATPYANVILHAGVPFGGTESREEVGMRAVGSATREGSSNGPQERGTSR